MNTMIAPRAADAHLRDMPAGDLVVIQNLNCYYGAKLAVRDVNVTVPKQQVTAFIGPSGCGKSTVLRTLNRMHEVIKGAHITGKVLINSQDIYTPETDVMRLRHRVGMVFQQPNPLPGLTIFDNVALGLRLVGGQSKAEINDAVEQSLTQAALWDEVKDKLDASPLALSGGQQQRLCVARAVAPKPMMLLMDEPASALDPIATYKIEQLIDDLKHRYTIVIVTHNMQQAARVADQTIVFTVDEQHIGQIVESGSTEQIFTNPKDARTEAYITGRIG